MEGFFTRQSSLVIKRVAAREMERRKSLTHLGRPESAKKRPAFTVVDEPPPEGSPRPSIETAFGRVRGSIVVLTDTLMVSCSRGDLWRLKKVMTAFVGDAAGKNCSVTAASSNVKWTNLSHNCLVTHLKQLHQYVFNKFIYNSNPGRQTQEDGATAVIMLLSAWEAMGSYFILLRRVFSKQVNKLSIDLQQDNEQTIDRMNKAQSFEAMRVDLNQLNECLVTCQKEWILLNSIRQARFAQ